MKSKKSNNDDYLYRMLRASVKKAYKQSRSSSRPTKAQLVQREREQRIAHVLAKHELTNLSPARLLEWAKLEGISIDMIEREIVKPLVSLKKKDAEEFAKISKRFRVESGCMGALIGIIALNVALICFLPLT